MSSFVDLFVNDRSANIHTRNVQVLGTGMFKVHKYMSPELLRELFYVRQIHYNLRNHHHFAISTINSVYPGSEIISNLEPRIWNSVPGRLIEFDSFRYFKKEIKRWQPEILPVKAM